MADLPPNNAQKSLAVCSLFESELLLWLMLRNWKHPWAEDPEFRSGFLETVTEVLHAAATEPDRHLLVEGLPTREMNFVAAAWYAEHCALGELERPDDEEFVGRQKWLDDVRRALPSCFCPQDDLP